MTLPPADRPRYDAVLLMESHGLAPSVRSGAFASMRMWSRLYQAGPYHLDMELAGRGRVLQLAGELLAGEGEQLRPLRHGTITLYDDHGAERVSAQLEPGGGFRLPIFQEGNYRLELDLGEEALDVGEIRIP